MNVHASREKTGPSLGFCFSSLFMMTSGPRTRVERRSEPSDLFDPDPMAWKRAPWEATLKPVATAKGIPLPSQCGTDGTKVCATLVGFLLDVFSVPRAHALGKSSVQNPPRTGAWCSLERTSKSFEVAPEQVRETQQELLRAQRDGRVPPDSVRAPAL